MSSFVLLKNKFSLMFYLCCWAYLFLILCFKYVIIIRKKVLYLFYVSWIYYYTISWFKYVINHNRKNFLYTCLCLLSVVLYSLLLFFYEVCDINRWGKYFTYISQVVCFMFQIFFICKKSATSQQKLILQEYLNKIYTILP